MLRLSQTRYRQLKAIVDTYAYDEIETIYTSMIPSRQSLVTPVIMPIDTYVSHWEKVEYDHRIFTDDMPEIITEKGERVLSKSEKILADKFLLLNIPYRYEFPLFLSGIGIAHPDFMLLNKHNRQEYYWEHMGKMDDPEYAEQALLRINAYQKNGFIPGRNLILSYETKKHPIDMKIAEIQMREYLL